MDTSHNYDRALSELLGCVLRRAVRDLHHPTGSKVTCQCSWESFILHPTVGRPYADGVLHGLYNQFQPRITQAPTMLVT